jgi:hypothetical protein
VFERFTNRARRVLVLAQEEARLLGHGFLGTEHILLGLIHEGEGIGAKTLESLNISLQAVREKVDDTIGPAGSGQTGSPPFTPRAKKCLELSLREALQLGHDYIGTEHLLLGLVREGEGVAAQVLQDLGASLPRVRRRVLELVEDMAPEELAGISTVEPVPPPELAWPVYPTKVVAGSETGLSSGGIELRVIGLLLFKSGVEVTWEASSVVDDAELAEPDVPDITVNDDLATPFRKDKRSHARRPEGGWVGRTFFVPGVPDAALTLHVDWAGAALEFEL